MAEQNPKVEALCYALADKFQMNSPEEKVQFQQIVVAELIKAGFVDAKGNVVVVKTTSTAPVVVAAGGSGPSGVAESYQQFMSRRNGELKPTVPDWNQRKAQIKEEWDANKGKTAAPRASAVAGAAAPKEKAKRKKTTWDLYMKEQMNDPKLKETKSGKDRLKMIAVTWKGMSEADKAPYVAKLAGLMSPVVAPQAEPAAAAPAEKEAEAEEAEEAEGEDE
jgi:hypothetical protein